MFGASVLVGLMSGWLAGIAWKGGGYGLLSDIILGPVFAAFVGAALMIALQRKIWPAQVSHA
jgi:uncharacterized membrane protein YeaQ/YmgE (transglycosylase-associated protein family)